MIQAKYFRCVSLNEKLMYEPCGEHDENAIKMAYTDLNDNEIKLSVTKVSMGFCVWVKKVFNFV